MKRFAVFAFAILLVAGLAIQPVAAAQPADLHIEQPDYVESDVVVTQDSDGTPIYEVSGESLLIRVGSVDHANISAIDVRDGPGTISYDESLDLYRFETDGQAGSSELLIQADVDGERVEFEAVIQVEQAAYRTETAESYADLREEANLWQDVEREAQQVNPDEDPEDVVSTGLTLARFFDSPFSTLFADIQGTLVMLFFRPGGWVVLGVLLAMTFIGVASGSRYRNRTQKQLADFGDIQIEKDEAFLEKARRILQQTDYNQVFPDDAARTMRQLFGRNPWIGFKQYMLLRSPRSVKGNVLQMMGEIDYKGYYELDDDGTVTRAFVSREQPDDAVTDGGEVTELALSSLDYENERHREFIDSIPPSQLDDTVFTAEADDIDLDNVNMPISNRDVDDADLLEHLNPEFPADFEHEESMATHLAQFIEFVLEHPHTDELGRSKPGMDLLSFLAEMDSTLADEAQFPVGHFMRREVMWCAEHLEADDEIRETLDRVDGGGVGSEKPEEES